MNIYEVERTGCYFRETKGGNQSLVRPDGTRRMIRTRNPFFDSVAIQAGAGWQRSSLFAKEHDIYDITAFSCTISTPIAVKYDENTAFVFMSCEEAERNLYKELSEESVIKCRENVEKFYSNPELQKKWEGVILHPICIKYTKTEKEFVPIALNEIGTDDSVLRDDMKRSFVGLEEKKLFEEIVFTEW